MDRRITFNENEVETLNMLVSRKIEKLNDKKPIDEFVIQEIQFYKDIQSKLVKNELS